MPQPRETLIYVARLRKTEKSAIIAYERAFPQVGIIVSLKEAINDVCVDRLVRAESCLNFAERVMSLDHSEEAMRTTIGRAYYSAHHSIRALSLWENLWDPDGHEESIGEFKVLLSNSVLRNKIGLYQDDWKRVVEARNNRHIADYSPYDVQREPTRTDWIGITNGKWDAAADFNITLAKELFQAALIGIGA